ncbi:unnamed protein product [Caenorhabditis bovis]|uniref:G-protein coupled receptors family 1 profile domain-containing protein n=1 Tax=Caenorhabditis bovis TaxID=2654633 RepID=A0A8S1EHS0_9PELO|nr:unnamed protein product [Caenorhabditis bovis]
MAYYNNSTGHTETSLDIASIRSIAHATWGLTALIGIPANIFVLAAILYFRDMRTISNIYIFNLAVADLLFLCGIPIVIFGQENGDWALGPTMCKLYISGNAVSQFASAVFIAVLSFDRFLAVCRPMVSSAWRTTQAALALSASSWAMVILEMTPLLLFVKLITIATESNVSKRTCMLFVGSGDVLDFSSDVSANYLNEVEKNMLLSRRFFTCYTFALSYLLPLIAVWYFYVKIIAQMIKRRRQMYIKRTVTKKRTTKVTILGLAIVISYTHCWLPFWIVQWSIEMNILFNSPYMLICVSHFAFALQYLNSAANPFLYVFLSDSFKKNVTKLLGRKNVETQKNLLKISCNNSTDTSRMLSTVNNPSANRSKQSAL